MEGNSWRASLEKVPMIWFIVLGSKKNFSPVISLKMMYSRGQCFEKAIARPFASSNVSAASTKWKLLSSLRVKSEKGFCIEYNPHLHLRNKTAKHYLWPSIECKYRETRSHVRVNA